jgi:hypothetical protein
MIEFKSLIEMQDAVVDAYELPEWTEYLQQFVVRATPSIADEYGVPLMSFVFTGHKLKSFVAIERIEL